MIAKLQELITKDEKMLRPRLLTNVNIMHPSELTLPNQPAVGPVEIARTTLGPIEATTIIVTSESTSTTEKPEPPRRSHKRIPLVEVEVHNNTEEEDTYMHQKNNKLHAQYIEALSEDLQRLKAKYDRMKLEFLRTLRRINERNVQRAINPRLSKLTQVGQAAAPTFIVSSKDTLESEDFIDLKSNSFPIEAEGN
jgi:hypothetical protein